MAGGGWRAAGVRPWRIRGSRYGCAGPGPTPRNPPYAPRAARHAAAVMAVLARGATPRNPPYAPRGARHAAAVMDKCAEWLPLCAPGQQVARPAARITAVARRREPAAWSRPLPPAAGRSDKVGQAGHGGCHMGRALKAQVPARMAIPRAGGG